jgi:hypothetical protein
MMAMAITGFSENQADLVLIKASFAIESEAKFELNRQALWVHVGPPNTGETFHAVQAIECH